MTNVRDLMSTDVVTVAPGLTLRGLVELFATRQIGGAPVMAGSRVVGVVSLNDIVSFEASERGKCAAGDATGCSDRSQEAAPRLLKRSRRR